MIDKTLYNIHLNTTLPFIAEGMRKDDLLRFWRSLDKIENYQTEGFNWQEYQRALLCETIGCRLSG